MPGTPPNPNAIKAAFERYIPLAKGAGFSGDSLVTIMAIAFAESGLDPAAQNTNSPTPGCPNGSVDRGIVQINSCYHPEVSDACAYNPVCAFQEAFRISNQGKAFGEWNTYKNNVPNYQLGLQTVEAILGGQPIPNPDAVAAAKTASTGAGDLPGTIDQGVLSAIQAVFQPLIAALPSFGIHIGLFMGALMLVIVGFWVLVKK